MAERKPPSEFLQYFGTADLPEDGKFALHLCVDRDELELLMSAAVEYCYRRIGEFDSRTYLPLFQAVNYLAAPSENPCGTGTIDEGTCFRVGTDSKAIQFFYNDPYGVIDVENRPALGQWERYEISLQKPPEWFRALQDFFFQFELVNEAIGYFPNDCFVVLPDSSGNDLSDLQNFADGLINLEFPHIRCNLQGQGSFQVELLNVPFGGSALILWDSPNTIQDIIGAILAGDYSELTNFEYLELARDITAIPPETLPNIFVEVDFEEDTDHFVEIYFLPRLDDSLTGLVGNGGGVRSVTACGSLEFILPDGTRIGRDNYGMEQTRRDNVFMATVEDVCAGMICASEEIARRILLAAKKENLISDISIGKDTGAITITNPTVDPDEDINAPYLELLNGQTYAVGLGFKEFMETINQAYTEGLTAAQLARRICTLYEMNTDQDDLDFQNVLFDYLQELVSYTFVPNAGDLSQIVWTYGSKVSSIVRYVLSLESPVPQSVVDVLELLVPYISATQVSLWYAAGKGQPRLDYLNYPDYRQPSKTYIFQVADFGATITSIERVQFFLESISKPIGNRWQYKFSGYFTNTATGQILDAFYYTNTNGTINNGVTTGADNNGSSRNFEAKPAYKDNHQYAAYRTNGVAEKLTGVFFQFLPAWNVADMTGAITITITDLGVQ